MTAGTESSLIQQGFLKIRDDLQKEQAISPEQAVIEELNILIEIAANARCHRSRHIIYKKHARAAEKEGGGIFPEVSELETRG